jgi:hypothetical protein
MPETKRTVRNRRPQRRAPRRKVAEPPVIEPIPFHKEAYYAGLGLADWAAERVAQMPAKLRILEKELVARGQKRSVGVHQQFDGTRQELARRGQELQESVRRGVREIWAALRGSSQGDSASSNPAPGAS